MEREFGGLDPHAVFVLNLVRELLARRLAHTDAPADVADVTRRALLQAEQSWTVLEESLGLASFTTAGPVLLSFEEGGA